MSEQEINESILEQEFNNTSDNSSDLEEIRDMRRQLMDVMENTPNPDDILMSNINRANDLLDSAQEGIEGEGSTSPRMYEVCAQLINAITSAAASIQNSTFGIQKHEYNMKMIAVKEKELVVKQAIAQGKMEQKSTGGGGGKVVAMSREDLLKMIEQEEMEIEISSVNTTENTTEN